MPAGIRQLPQRAGQPALGRVVHRGHLTGRQGNTRVAGDADARLVQEIGRFFNLFSGKHVRQPFGELPRQDGGSFDGHALGQQQVIAGGSPARRDQLFPLHLADQGAGQDRAVNAIGYFGMPADDSDAQLVRRLLEAGH